jgi:hypothetical protein
MIDLQIIEIRDVLALTAVYPVPDLTPTTYLLIGEDFSTASEVYINEVRSPSIFIESRTKILAQVPPTQVNQPLLSVSVFSSRLTRTERSLIEFRLGNPHRTVDGMEKLIQVFLKILLQDPDSDIFERVGGGLLRSLGTGGTVNTAPAVATSSLHAAVTTTTTQLRKLQIANPRLRVSERLRYATVLDTSYNPNTLRLGARIELGNEAGKNTAVKWSL